jgi:hypothetical protein
MGSFSKTLPVLLGAAVLVALGIGGYFAFTCIVERLRSMDFKIAAVTTSASVVLLAAMIHCQEHSPDREAAQGASAPCGKDCSVPALP